MTNYYNTNRLTGKALTRAIQNAKSQEEIILLWFQSRPGKSYAPHEILNILDFELNYPPLTSVRRAITNLEKRGCLVKTDELIDGSYGVQVHRWRLNIKRTPITSYPVQPSLF